MTRPEPRPYTFLERIPTLAERRGLSDQVGWADSFRAGGDAFVGLFATNRAGPLYRRAGFTSDGMSGMSTMLRPER